MRTIKFCSVVFGLYMSTDKTAVQAFCLSVVIRKQDSVMPALRQPSA